MSSNFSFSTRAGHGVKGDPWQNYMGKGKLEIGRMVIRISVQYRGAVECNIATDQAKHSTIFAKVWFLQIKNSWIPTVSVSNSLFCILRARHPKSFWDTLSQNYIKCFRHYSRWVFVSLNWDFFPVFTELGEIWRSPELSLVNIFVINQSLDLLTRVCAVLSGRDLGLLSPPLKCNCPLYVSICCIMEHFRPISSWMPGLKSVGVSGSKCGTMSL